MIEWPAISQNTSQCPLLKLKNSIRGHKMDVLYKSLLCLQRQSSWKNSKIIQCFSTFAIFTRHHWVSRSVLIRSFFGPHSVLVRENMDQKNSEYGHFLRNACKGAYIKYVGGGAGGFYKFVKKIFIAQETKDLNISWPSNFFRKYFMASPINFSFLFKAYL